MKRALCLVIAFTAILGLAACGGNDTAQLPQRPEHNSARPESTSVLTQPPAEPSSTQSEAIPSSTADSSSSPAEIPAPIPAAAKGGVQQPVSSAPKSNDDITCVLPAPRGIAWWSPDAQPYQPNRQHTFHLDIEMYGAAELLQDTVTDIRSTAELKAYCDTFRTPYHLDKEADGNQTFLDAAKKYLDNEKFFQQNCLLVVGIKDVRGPQFDYSIHQLVPHEKYIEIQIQETRKGSMAVQVNNWLILAEVPLEELYQFPGYILTITY